MLERLQMAGPLGSTDITPLRRYYGPGRHLLVFGRLPGVAGYTAYLAPAISPGTRKASPVAWHVLVTVLSLSPRRGEDAASVRFRHPILPSPYGSGLGPRIWPFEATFAFTVVTAR